MADDKKFMSLLEKKIEWMGQLYEAAKNIDGYQWTRINSPKHRCGGEIWVYVETTGIGYVCEKCEDAEVL